MENFDTKPDLLICSEVKVLINEKRLKIVYFSIGMLHVCVNKNEKNFIFYKPRVSFFSYIKISF